MTNRLTRLSGVLVAVIAGFIVAPSVTAAEYKIDPAHTFVQFEISHLGFSTLVGRFNRMQGVFNWDRASPEGSSIEITIDTASVDTNWAERDKHLREEDFLHVEKYPTAIFKSTNYTGDADSGVLEGMLTLHGVTRPITLEVTAVGEGDDPWGGYRAGFDATTTLRRSDFGMEYDLGPKAETMEFKLHVEGIRQQ